jgi:fatty-acyl-CoA synthase
MVIIMNSNVSQIEQQLLQITRQLLKDCHHYGAIRELNLNSDLEKELGMGSIEKSELFYRIESALSIQLPEILLAEASTLRELCDAILKASPFIKPLPTAHSPTIDVTEIDPLKSKTLIESLESHVEKEPNRPHVFIQNDRGEEKLISYQLLYESAKTIAAQLQQLGLDSEQTVAIMLPTSEEFFYAYFGVLLAGGIPVPIYPPFRRNKLEEYMLQESKILHNAQVSILITFQEVAILSHLLTSFVPSLQHVVTLQDLESIGKCSLIVPKIKPESPALIQYTSGSTGDPKGVLLSHYNLVSNISCAAKSIGIKPTDHFVSWLPLYHDMGLIGTWLGSLYFGLPLTLLSPLTFLSRPEKWLWAIHYHRATLSPAPNFGYELCLNKINDRHLEGLDLRSWRLAFNGAEAIYPSTLRRFAKRFAKYGFDEKALYPSYGLAENSVALCFPPAGRGPLYDKVKRAEFDQLRNAIPANPKDKNVHEFVSCGQPIIGHEIRIVDPQNNPLPAGLIPEISVTSLGVNCSSLVVKKILLSKQAAIFIPPKLKKSLVTLKVFAKGASPLLGMKINARVLKNL